MTLLRATGWGCLAGASFLLHPVQAHAQTPGAELALIQTIRIADGGEGMRAIRAGSEEEIVEVDLGDLLNDGDDSFTLAGTRAAIRFTDDQSLVRMNENTVLKVRAEGTERGALRRVLELEGGELWARITGRTGTETQIRTPSGVAAVRGTDFIVRYNPETGETTVITLEGLLEFFNAAGRVDVPGGRTVRVRSDEEGPETRPTEADDLVPSQVLLDDQAEAGENEMVQVSITGSRGREVTIWVSRAALEAIGRGRR